MGDQKTGTILVPFKFFSCISFRLFSSHLKMQRTFEIQEMIFSVFVIRTESVPLSASSVTVIVILDWKVS